MGFFVCLFFVFWLLFFFFFCFDNDDDYDEENARKTELAVTLAFCLMFLSFDNSCAGYGSDDDDNNKFFFFFFLQLICWFLS